MKPRFSIAANMIGAVVLAGLMVMSVSGPVAVAEDDFGADGGPEAAGGDPDLGAFGLPTVLREAGDSDIDQTNDESSDETNTANEKTTPDNLTGHYFAKSVAWRAPDYSNQDGVLGWQADVFKIPPGLEARVAFWKEIYAKYTSDQGVLHDLDDITVVYEMIDFGSIMRDESLSTVQKNKARSKKVKQRKREIAADLERLSKLKSFSDLKNEQDRKLISLFKIDPIGDTKKLKTRLKQAAGRKRVRFQLGQKDKFVLGVFYSGRYLRSMEKIFKAERLPIELTRLPFVESSFNIQARSRVGASGVWQFMPRTARPGMMVNREVDERNDPLTATVAAARLMRSNFEQLRSWPLALTAYNHGAAGVARAVKKTGARDLVHIIDNYEGRRFGFASSNFYACFLAALEIERNAPAALGDVKWSVEFDGTEVELDRPMNWRALVAFYDGDIELTVLQNPHLTSHLRKKNLPIPRRTFVRVPSSRTEIAKEFLLGKMSEDALKKRLAEVPMPRSSARR